MKVIENFTEIERMSMAFRHWVEKCLGDGIVPPADVARLAEAIAELFADPERAVAMGKAGCERVQAQFSLDAMVRAYLSLYEEQVKAARNGVQSAAQSRNALR